MFSSVQWIKPLPALREVHFWCIFPEEVDSNLLRKYRKLLSADELVEISKAKTEVLRNCRLLAKTLMRCTLSRYTNGAVHPASLNFQRNAYGKPQVVWPSVTTIGRRWEPPSLSFNLSHTSSLIACCIALDSAVGVDVETKERKLNSTLVTFARKKFTGNEVDWLESAEDARVQRHRFMQLWTLKEAYVKAVGKGISRLPLKEFSFAITPSNEARELLKSAIDFGVHPQAESITLNLSACLAGRERPAKCWKFFSFEPSSEHVASICLEETMERVCGDLPFKVLAWKTIPLSMDEHLREAALALGITMD